MEGQLIDSGLTLGDVEQIRQSLIESLKGRYHVRVKYPGNEALTAENAPEQPALESAEAMAQLPASTVSIDEAIPDTETIEEAATRD